MRFKTVEARRSLQPARWFAWYPVRIGYEWVWLEHVNRKWVRRFNAAGYWHYWQHG